MTATRSSRYTDPLDRRVGKATSTIWRFRPRTDPSQEGRAGFFGIVSQEEIDCPAGTWLDNLVVAGATNSAILYGIGECEIWNRLGIGKVELRTKVCPFEKLDSPTSIKCKNAKRDQVRQVVELKRAPGETRWKQRTLEYLQLEWGGLCRWELHNTRNRKWP